ncbi:MAG: hypothetical protein IPJ34_38690 [Myxococcales bacterium]|nr:hypothetical protein [Myxococcales bacterium]
MRTLTSVACVSLLVACGGGGGAPANTPTPAASSAAPAASSAPAAPASAAASTAAPTADAPNDVAHPQAAECKLKARDVPGKEGATRFLECPAGCAKGGGTVWGSDVYTDDSAVCPAAIHAGAIPESGGKVLVTFTPGGSFYVGTQRNGVSTSDWGKWGRSFYAQAIDATGKTTSKAPAPLDTTKPAIGCNTNADRLKEIGATRAVCPADCKGGTVYGSGPYTSDSSVCAAARHAGILKDGGEVGVTIVPTAKSFKGSNKNGVSSSNWDKEHVAFTVAK